MRFWCCLLIRILIMYCSFLSIISNYISVVIVPCCVAMGTLIYSFTTLQKHPNLSILVLLQKKTKSNVKLFVVFVLFSHLCLNLHHLANSWQQNQYLNKNRANKTKFVLYKISILFRELGQVFVWPCVNIITDFQCSNPSS